MQAKQQMAATLPQADSLLSTAQAKAVCSAIEALGKVGVGAGSLVLPATPHRCRTTVFWNYEGVGVTVAGGLSECHEDRAAFATAYGVDQEPDQLFELARRLAYPTGGERLILDDYRNIARQIVEPDGVRLA